MALAFTDTEQQITFDSGSVTKTVTSATEVVSDIITLDANVVSIGIQFHADNQGTPASGDTAVFRIRWSMGDVLGAAGAHTYDTPEHALLQEILDTYATNNPGEDPARRSEPIIPVSNKFQIACVCANAATRNILIACRLIKKTVA
jgi:hypothetical protein